MSYALVELSTGNMIGFFKSEHEALDEVLDSIQHYGQASIDTVALGFNDPAGPVRAIAEGPALAKLALAAASKAVPDAPSETIPVELKREERVTVTKAPPVTMGEVTVNKDRGGSAIGHAVGKLRVPDKYGEVHTERDAPSIPSKERPSSHY